MLTICIKTILVTLKKNVLVFTMGKNVVKEHAVSPIFSCNKSTIHTISIFTQKSCRLIQVEIPPLSAVKTWGEFPYNKKKTMGKISPCFWFISQASSSG